MNKVSILTLSLSVFLNSVCVFAVNPKTTRKRITIKGVQLNKNYNSVNTSVETNTEEMENLEVQDQINIQTNVSNNEDNIDIAITNLNTKIKETKEACSDIKHNLDTIFGLSVATTVSSGLGTAAAGGALAVGIAKSSIDKKIEEIKFFKSRTDNLSEDPEELKEQLLKILPELDTDYAALEKEIEEETKKSKTLGNVRTGLLAGATVTSAVSTGTSIGTTVSATKLAEKMNVCNIKLSELKIAKNTLEAELEENKNESEIENTTSIITANNILAVCVGYDVNNIKTLKTTMTASAIVSGVGTAAAGTGTVTSIMANTDKVRSDDTEHGIKKEKTLNLVSNIAAGVTTGTSAASTILSATSIEKAKKDSEMAEKCENILAQ